MGKTKSIQRVADDYLDLVKRFPLRPIRTKAAYREAIEIHQALLIRADDPGLSEGESDYLDALDQFISTFEDRHYPLEHLMHTPIERLKYLLEQSSMNTTDLGKLLGSGRGQASLILNGKRQLSKANIRNLAEHFRVSPAMFL